MLTTLVTVGVLIVAILHLWFCVLEMFLWQKSLGLKIFKIDADFARRSAALAANQGLYNLFLSAGLFWSLLSGDPLEAVHLQLFFLSCVALAGVYAGLTVSIRILFVQALPAIITLGLLAKSL